MNVLTLADIKNIPNVSNKTLKLDKKEQNRIVESLKTPLRESPGRYANTDLTDLQESEQRRIKFGSEKSGGNEAQNLREQLVKMITEQINAVEDKNVRNCAGLLKDIVANKLSNFDSEFITNYSLAKLQNIIEDNIERQFQDMQKSYEKNFSKIIEEK